MYKKRFPSLTLPNPLIGRVEAAKQQFELSLASDPNHMSALIHLAQLLTSAPQQHARAELLFQR